MKLTSKFGSISRFRWSAVPLAVIFLLIEFFDELHYTIDGAVLPVLRDEFMLSYAQVGLLLGLPGIISTLIEPVLMLLGDTRLRKSLIVGGGLAVVLSLFLLGTSQSFLAAIIAFTIGYPASGAFVNLAQATLMDMNPRREAQMMARWTVYGSVGNLLGPLVVAAGFSLALGWRWVFFALAALALILIFAVAARPLPKHHPGHGEDHGGSAVNLKTLFANIREGISNRRLLGWVTLLYFSDLLLDVFTGFVPLYFTDVVGATPTQASLAFSLLLAAHLASDLVLIPILEKIPGRTVVRITAAAAIPVYVAWLLVPWPLVKLILLPLIPLATTGWYPVLQGETYATMPGRSATTQAVSSLASIAGSILVWFVGWVANETGLQSAMWLLLAGPLVLVLFVPRAERDGEGVR
jgi:FSR family fosmidomycin resistance protein-like MFS transporter